MPHGDPTICLNHFATVGGCVALRPETSCYEMARLRFTSHRRPEKAGASRMTRASTPIARGNETFVNGMRVDSPKCH